MPSGCCCWPFAREGAQAFLTGRRLAPLERVVTGIKRGGGAARIAQVDALDEASTERHLDQVVEELGGVDISFNAVGFKKVQGVPLVDLSRNGRLFLMGA